jgi:uncharacterized membrane protein YeaQ/YmgE (transglycosylase-associated protein family)
LIGYFAERIFKTRLFGRLPDIIIGIIGGIGLYVVAATINSIIYNDVRGSFTPICLDAAKSPWGNIHLILLMIFL